jgi:hypothetical protein
MAKKKNETAGDRLKAACAERYEMNPGELALLEHGRVLADLGERLAAKIGEEGLESHGAAGQVVANPLHRDYYDCTTKLAAIIDALQLPDRPAGKLSTSARAQRAARARWAKAKAG